MRALIIENSKVYSILLDNLLVQQGLECDISENIEDARQFSDTQRYDLICVSHQLKDGYGSEFVEFCKQHPVNKSALILYLTSDQTVPEKLASLAVDKFVIKQGKQEISHQIIRFIESNLDPIFAEGRILFVEDSKTVARVILSALENTGFRVDHFANAEKAWEFFVQEEAYGSSKDAFDLVITDINLEGKMTGKQLVEKIRYLEDARGFLPIFAITGDNSDELRLSLYESGVNDYVQKPVMARELIVRVGNLISNKRLLDKVHDQRRELFALATTDKLTGCHNRHSLMEFSAKFLALAKRHVYPVSMLMIDLDHFKVLNDTHGHSAGDAVLAAVGHLLTGFFREGDLVARYGGEEFVVLMSHCDKEMACIRAENLRISIAELDTENMRISASIGISARTPEQAHSFDTLFAAADKAVYAAKKNGRDCVVFQALDD